MKTDPELLKWVMVHEPEASVWWDETRDLYHQAFAIKDWDTMEFILENIYRYRVSMPASDRGVWACESARLAALGRKNLARAKRFLEEAEAYPPDGLSDLWIARAAVAELSGDLESARLSARAGLEALGETPDLSLDRAWLERLAR